jgi:hypothetical protein
MKYLKKFELRDYKSLDIDDLGDTYEGHLYLFSDKSVDIKDTGSTGPLLAGSLKGGDDTIKVYLNNRADASDTSSEYIYKIKTKKPLYKKKSNSFWNIFDDDTEKYAENKDDFSGYFTNDWLTHELCAWIKVSDITEFKKVSGFVLYDKDIPAKKDIELSEEAEYYLSSYIGGTIFHDKLTSDIKKELEQFKPDKPVKIFKGIEEVQIKHQSNVKPPYKKGQIIDSKFEYETSWTSNVLIARRFIDDYPSSPTFVAMMTADPKDILVDTRMLKGQYYHTNQREIIMLSGSYTFKLVWEGEF